jgi:hypothetical protein
MYSQFWFMRIKKETIEKYLPFSPAEINVNEGAVKQAFLLRPIFHFMI